MWVVSTARRSARGPRAVSGTARGSQKRCLSPRPRRSKSAGSAGDSKRHSIRARAIRGAWAVLRGAGKPRYKAANRPASSSQMMPWLGKRTPDSPQPASTMIWGPESPGRPSAHARHKPSARVRKNILLARREHYALGIMLAARWLTIPFTMVESPPPSSSPTASPRPGVWSAMRQAGRTSSSSPHDASARPRWRCARDQLTQHKVPVAYADLFRAIHAHGVIGVNRQPTPPGGGVD